MSINIEKLIQRSKTRFELDSEKIPCAYQQSPLVAVEEQPQLILDPIWANPIDDIEGPLYEQYIKANPGYTSLYVREAVAERLYKAASSLPKHLKLVLRAGHRPLAVQRIEFRTLLNKYSAEHPELTSKEALEFARRHVSDPDIALPPHCCGAAADVDVFDTKTNNLVDFGCPVNNNSELAALHSDKTTSTQYANRMTLLKTMLSTGFAPNYDEWWHFTYGSTAWACFYEQPHSLYGVIEPEL